MAASLLLRPLLWLLKNPIKSVAGAGLVDHFGFEGAGRAKVFDEASDLTGDTISEAAESAREHAGKYLKENSPFRDFLGDHWGKLLGGAGGIWALSKLPKGFVRNFAIAATVLAGVVIASHLTTRQEFKDQFTASAKPETPELNQTASLDRAQSALDQRNSDHMVRNENGEPVHLALQEFTPDIDA